MYKQYNVYYTKLSLKSFNVDMNYLSLFSNLIHPLSTIIGILSEERIVSTTSQPPFISINIITIFSYCSAEKSVKQRIVQIPTRKKNAQNRYTGIRSTFQNRLSSKNYSSESRRHRRGIHRNDFDWFSMIIERVQRCEKNEIKQQAYTISIYKYLWLTFTYNKGYFT